MTTNKLQLIANIVFIVYCIGLVVAISSVNHNLKSAIDNREVKAYTTLEVVESYPSQQSLTVVSGKGYQSTADQWTAQKAMNHDGSELVQQSQRNNHSEPVQKSAQMYQYQLTDTELAQ
jgi:hypothetical protein